MRMTKLDNREFFRIDDRLPLELRQIGREEFVRLENIIRCSSTCKVDTLVEMRFLSDIVFRSKGEENELLTYLRIIDKKLDTVIDLLGRQKTDDSYKRLYTQVNLSGAGIKFISDEPFTDGDLLELKIGLPLSPFPNISTLCQVVRARRSAQTSKEEWEVALKFLVINDHDRDFIINYIFTKERESLRNKSENSG
jgi:hypothetical protein